MIKCNTAKCKHNKNGYCMKEWNNNKDKNKDKNKESLLNKIKNVFK